MRAGPQRAGADPAPSAAGGFCPPCGRSDWRGTGTAAGALAGASAPPRAAGARCAADGATGAAADGGTLMDGARVGARADDGAPRCCGTATPSPLRGTVAGGDSRDGAGRPSGRGATGTAGAAADPVPAPVGAGGRAEPGGAPCVAGAVVDGRAIAGVGAAGEGRADVGGGTAAGGAATDGRAEVGGGATDGFAGTAPVGSFARNVSPFGCLDMAGNVAEVVADWFAAYPSTDGPLVDPQGPADGTERVRRGGHYRCGGAEGPLQSTFRDGTSPVEPVGKTTGSEQGLRVCRSPDAGGSGRTR